jgi:dTDP-4-amino-4,6-dideoxygalactose transaminase
MRIGRTLPPAASPIYLRDIHSGIKGLFRGQQELSRFESELKAYFGVEHCFLVSSGKAALTLILQALKDMHPEKNEVLIPAFTCYSVPSSIVHAGLKVRLCDIKPDTIDFDFDQLAMSLKRSANGLLAIIPTHLFGLPADVCRIRNLVDDPEVTIIEDAAQTMGAKWKGKKLGTLGDVSFFSLGRGKALSAVEGGIILTDRNDIADKIRSQLAGIPGYNIFALMRLFFMAISLTLFLHPALFWFPKSLPILKLGETIYDPHFKMRKMSPYQAGLSKGWQKKLDDFQKCRSENSKHWSSLIQQLSNYQLSAMPAPCSAKPASLGSYVLGMSVVPSLIRFPVRVDNEELRNRILMESDRLGLGIMFTYPDSIDSIYELNWSFQDQKFPVAKEIANQLITLPTHPFVSQDDKAKIAALISQITH